MNILYWIKAIIILIPMALAAFIIWAIVTVIGILLSWGFYVILGYGAYTFIRSYFIELTKDS